MCNSDHEIILYHLLILILPSDFKKRMLVSLFIKLQEVFFRSAKTSAKTNSSTKTTSKKRGEDDQGEGGGVGTSASVEVSTLCSESASLLEACIDHDLREFVESCHKIASSITANSQFIHQVLSSNL